MPLNRIRALAITAASVVAGVIATPAMTAHAATAPTGNDISWPQCGQPLPAHTGFAIIGANNGLPYSPNPCLSTQLAWGAAAAPVGPAYYMNIAEPGSRSIHWNRGGPRHCSGSGSDSGCAYDYGWMAAAEAIGAVKSNGGVVAGRTVWVDVETGNTWSSSKSLNAADISGALDYLRLATGTAPGVYSTTYQWGVIAGGARLGSGVLDWVAGATSASQARSWCSQSHSFSGGPVRLVQFPDGAIDGDVAC